MIVKRYPLRGLEELRVGLSSNGRMLAIGLHDGDKVVGTLALPRAALTVLRRALSELARKPATLGECNVSDAAAAAREVGRAMRKAP